MPYDEPLSLGECPACSSRIHRMEVCGLEMKGNLIPLDAQQAMGEVIAGRRLYRITFAGGAPLTMRPADNLVLAKLATAEPGERPYVVAEHPCAAVSRPLGVPAGGTPAENPPVPPAGRTAPYSGPQGVDGAASGAGTRRSDGPRCSGCGQPCADGTYASVTLGDVVMWAQHVAECP